MQFKKLLHEKRIEINCDSVCTNAYMRRNHWKMLNITMATSTELLYHKKYELCVVCGNLEMKNTFQYLIDDR